jgi:tetratricopeptide (TPR) repeat protein
LKTKLFIVLLLASTGLFSQEIFNYDNSVKFGVYLYQSAQYEFAAKELERCLFLKPEDYNATLFLLKVYRKMNEYDKAVRLASSGRLMDTESFGIEYFKMLIEAGKLKDASVLISEKAYFKDKSDLKLSTILLQKEWKNGFDYRNENSSVINKSLSEIVDKSMAFKRKSPVLVGILSTILPGSGKAYSHRWKDGLISFVMTASTGFVAVRGFNRSNQSVYPWIMGTLFTVYYTGNIYGSVQAANKFNKSKEDEWTNQVRDFVLHD